MNAPVSLLQPDPCDPEIDARLASHANATLRKGHQPLTAQLLLDLRNDLPAGKRADSYIMIDTHGYTALVASNDLMCLFDPVVKSSLLVAGQAGTLLGMHVLTDAYKNPDRKVLPVSRVYVMSADGSEGRACNIGR